MFTFYGDMSGSDDTPVMTAAGFVTTAESWTRLVNRWKVVLGTYGVESLHMKEYVHCKGEYQSWKKGDEKHRKLLRELIAMIAPFARNSFSSSICMSDFRNLDTVSGIRAVISPVAFVGCTVVAKVLRWAERHGISRRQLFFLFEDGDVDKGDFMNLCKRYYGFSPSFETKQRVKAFETADLLAYEISLVLKILTEGQDIVKITGLGSPLEMLSHIPNGIDGDDWGVYQNPKLADIYQSILSESGANSQIFVGEENALTRRIRDLRRRYPKPIR
jgi:hypothetical protein